MSEHLFAGVAPEFLGGFVEELDNSVLVGCDDGVEHAVECFLVSDFDGFDFFEFCLDFGAGFL